MLNPGGISNNNSLNDQILSYIDFSSEKLNLIILKVNLPEAEEIKVVEEEMIVDLESQVIVKEKEIVPDFCCQNFPQIQSEIFNVSTNSNLNPRTLSKNYK
jgi:hypothetical protein